MSNHINDIEITNFKSIRHQKIEGCRRINLFIGYPNVGKSNVLEAMSLLSYMSTTPKLSDILRVDGFSELFFDGSINDDIAVGVLNKYKIIAQFKKDSFLNLKKLKNYQQENSDSKQEGTWETEGSINIYHDRIETPNSSTFGSKFEIKKYQFRGESIKSNSGYASLDFPLGQNLYYVIESNKALRSDISELLSFYQLRLAFDKGDKYSLRILKTLSDDTIFLLPFHQIADTLQRLIFYKAAIASNKNTILLFEEPEAHMFPPYIRKFTADVMFDKTNQFFIATHSPYVLEAFLEDVPDDLSIYLVDYKNGETIIKRLGDQELEEVIKYGVDLFFNLESYLNNGQVNNA